MKKTFLIFAQIFLMILSGKLLSQTVSPTPTVPIITPGGFFDAVYDKDGNQYSAANLQIVLNNSVTSFGKFSSGQSLYVSATTTCQAGFFKVFFANGSGMETVGNATHTARRNTVCELLQNLSGLLGLASWNSTVSVNILVDDISNYAPSPSTSGILGLATAFYAFPGSPSSPNPGIALNQIQKTIRSKQDAWNGICSPMTGTGGSGFYHGVMAFNFANAGINWFDNYAGGLAAFNQLDLYTVILHEITHALGFASLINGNGISKFSSANNYYSNYDRYLIDKNLNPLLTSTACSSQYGLAFSSNTLFLQPACTNTYQTDYTNCNTACKYNSSNISNMPIYTPDCFEPPSSLSHFEDMCYPTNTPTNNNMYFTMSNANGNGVNKRYLKLEEVKVFCDLGYSYAANPTYTSLAVGATHSYTLGACSNPTIWGQNDGIVNNVYTYTSAGGPLTITITSILANDAPSPFVTGASCVESVYNNGTASVSGGIITFSPVANFFGPVLLRYIPINANNDQGNITYIFAYIFPAACSPVSPCDMVQNGGFESNSSCGPLSPTVSASCWYSYTGGADLFVSGCTNCPQGANLGTATYSSSPTFSSHLPGVNNAVINLGGYSLLSGPVVHESLSSYLGTPLVNGQNYNLSFWAYQYSGVQVDAGNQYAPTTTVASNSHSVPLVLTFAANNAYVPPANNNNNFPQGTLTVFNSPTLAPLFNAWKYYSFPFTYSSVASPSATNLFVGIDGNLTYTNITTALSSYFSVEVYYVLIDDISIRPANLTPTFSLPASNICTSMGYTNLAQYINLSGGVFSGQGVSVVTTTNGSQYNFNSPANLPNGLYTITYTYTDNIGCTQNIYQQVTISNVTNNIPVVTNFTNSNVCSSNTGTLSVISPSTGYTYTWQPGNIISNTTVVTPTVSTTYSVLGAINASCSIIGTITVLLPPTLNISATTTVVCSGSPTTLTAVGNFNTFTWSPGSSTLNAIVVTPTANTIYSLSATDQNGCVRSKTISIAVSPAPTITLSAIANCSGTNTLSASGSYYNNIVWYPGVIISNSLIVMPGANSVYTAVASNNLGCIATKTIAVTSATLSLTASSPIACSGSTSNLNALGNFSSISWQPGNYTVNPLPLIVSNQVYTATAYFSGGCSITHTFQFNVVDFSYPAITMPSTVICLGYSQTLSINNSAVTVTWQPSSSTNTSIVVSPSVNTTYSASATNSVGCVYNVTTAISIVTTCCSGTLATLNTVLPTSQTVTGTKAINFDLTIPSGANLTLHGEFLIAQNVKITVNNGSTLTVEGSHLYACSTEMWQGIVLNDGGKVICRENPANDYSSLIEDAITAIDASNQYTTALHPFIDVSKTTFNKNYIDINVSNFLRTSTSYSNALSIHSSVFTCRNLTFTNTAWPQTGTSSSVTTFSADLRFATFSPTAMAAPYLGQVGFSVTTLKSPYSSQSSQSAIKLNEVGGYSLPTYYPIVIGDGSNSGNFNVFDSHHIFIDATRSNIYCYNNVFQKTLFESTPGVGIKTINDYSNSNIYEGFLDLVPPTNPSAIINRFYDCHTGIEVGNLGWLNLKYDEFKSTQSSTNAISPNNQGYCGINILSNRFRNYIINSCKFYNINTGIYAGVTIDNVAPYTSNYGQVWSTFDITENLFSPSTTTVTGNGFISNGVVMDQILFVQSPPGTNNVGNFIGISPLNGIRIKNNNFDKVWRGVQVSNFSGGLFGNTTSNNTISIVADVNTSNPQWGVKFLGNYASTINSNTITGFTTSTATTMQGVYASFCTNSGVQCNSLVALPIGAQFSGMNSGMQWRKNAMNNNARGMQLSNAGVIGQQGYLNGPNDNIWQGSTWTGTVYNTHTFDYSTFAINSPIFYRNATGGYIPTNNNGNPTPQSYQAVGSLSIASSSSPIPDCITTKPGRGKDWYGTKGWQAVVIAGRLLSYGNHGDTTTEINDFLLYRDLNQDTTLRESSDTLIDFYDAHSSSAIGILLNIEELFAQGDISSATSALVAFTATTSIQTNYKEFYELYAAYTSTAGLTTTQMASLADLANKCPFIDGAIVYNARALYNIVSGLVVLYNDDGCESGTGARAANTQQTDDNLVGAKNATGPSKNYILYPNPATDKLFIYGDAENEKINLIITDVNSKQLFNKTLTITDYHTELKLDLLNGVYFVTLVNKNNERVIKKLVIAK